MNNIMEGLRPNDLQYLVSNYISIDQYTSKLDDDNITTAFFCNEMEVAEDLRDFVEKNFYIEIKDVEVGDSLTEDNKYILFVELERNINFPKILMDILDSINNVTANKDWTFKTFGMSDKIALTLDSLKENVRLTKLRDQDIEGDEVQTEESKEEEEPVKESVEPIVINDDGWKRTYISRGYISQEDLELKIAESKTLNSRDMFEITLLENAFPGSQVITTDSNAFIINGDKILMLA